MDFSKPQEIILQMGLRDGMRVVDIGSGVGHYTLAAAPIVGEEGRVYAVDVQEPVLKALKREVVERGFSNVSTIWGDIEQQFGTKLKGEVIDAVIIANTLFQLDDKNAAVKEIKRILKPGGLVLAVDWAGCYNSIGPEENCVVEEHVAERLFIDAGFHKEKAFRAGPHHYALVFKKPS
tara:strand:- start:18210 stop:18743 length:534 start_codon:yes stop_codon:yes gene_type:complete